MTILKESCHAIVIIEHDRLINEDAQEMTEYVSQVMRKTAADPYFKELVANAERVFYFDEGPRAEARIVAKANPRTQRSQTTLEAFT